MDRTVSPDRYPTFEASSRLSPGSAFPGYRYPEILLRSPGQSRRLLGSSHRILPVFPGSLHFWKLTADISAIPSAQVNGRKDMQQRCSMTVFHTAAVSALTVCWFAVWIPIPQAEKRSWQTAVSMTVLSMSRKARSTLSGIGLQ